MDGFLGTRASFMLDVVFLAMFAVLPVLGWSIWLVRCRRNYTLHKRVQLGLFAVLLTAVTLFELEMRAHGWEHLASPGGTPPATVYAILYIHLFFAVSTAVLWIAVIGLALRKFPRPPAPGAHSRTHRRWAWIAAVDLALTALTGWIFYLAAFL